MTSETLEARASRAIDRRAALTAPNLVRGSSPNGHAPPDPAAGSASLSALVDLPGGNELAVRVTCLDEIEAQPVEWVWKHRIAANTLNLVEGPQEAGKTTLVCDLIARLTRGHRWPDEPVGIEHEPADVLIIGPEDTASRVLRPRLDAAGADVRRVFLAERAATPDNPFGALELPRDLALVRGVLAQRRPRLLYIDALNDLLVGVKINDDADVRRALRPLVAVAEATGAAILATRHFGKGGNRHAMNAGLGSVAFTAIARVVLQVYPDRDDPSTRLLAVAKNNLAPRAATLKFGLESTGEDAPPAIAWRGADQRSADDLQARYRAEDEEDDGGALEEAKDWLRELLDTGPRASKDVQSRAKAEGLSWRTVQRAKKALAVVHYREGFGSGFMWRAANSGVNAPRPGEDTGASTTVDAPAEPSTLPLL